MHVHDTVSLPLSHSKLLLIYPRANISILNKVHQTTIQPILFTTYALAPTSTNPNSQKQTNGSTPSKTPEGPSPNVPSLPSYPILTPLSANYNYLYFLKCVSTTYHYISSSREPLYTHQYSVTSHERPLSGGHDPDHPHAVHSKGGVPGVFFVYDISPMRVIKREERGNTLGGFLTAVVGGVGGILVIAGWIDRAVWEVERGLRKKAMDGKHL
jgi:Endoplasmic reticulum vesicle transporter